MSSNDNIFEIFSWLPAKDLLRFSTGCRAFSNLLQEAQFVKQHCKNWLKTRNKSNDNNGHGFFLQPDSVTWMLDKLELHWLSGIDDPDMSRSAGVPESSIGFLKESSRLLASSNGLVLCQPQSRELFLCNPAGKCMVYVGLPESLKNNYNPCIPLHVAFFTGNNHYYPAVEFPYDYNLWVFHNDDDEWRPNVEYAAYSFEGGRGWRLKGRISTGIRNVRLEKPVICDEEMFFVSDCGVYHTKESPGYLPYIVACDLENGKSRFIKLPRDAYKGFGTYRTELSLFPWEDEVEKRQTSLCLVRLKGLTLTVWVLGDVKRRKSWRRLAKIRVKSLELSEFSTEGVIDNGQLLHISGYLVMKGHLIFATSKRVYEYGLIGNNLGLVKDLGSHSCGYRVRMDAYANTLRPCGEATIDLPI